MCPIIEAPGAQIKFFLLLGIDPSILTSAAFELVQASQALQAVQAVQPLLASESPPLMTPLTQVLIDTVNLLLFIIMCHLGPILVIQHGSSTDSPGCPALSHTT